MIDKHLVPVVLLTAGTLFLGSCAEKIPEPTVKDPETTPTQISYNHRIVNSIDGQRQYRMETPLLERYELAEEPFVEFTQGIKVETFADSTVIVIENDIVANYAHFNETTELWTAVGNVVARNHLQDRTLYTERLYWNQAEKKIYSDTLSRVVDGGSVHVGSNFEADDSFETWTFRNTSGQIEVEGEFGSSGDQPADSLPGETVSPNPPATSGPPTGTTEPPAAETSVPDEPETPADTLS